MKDIKYTEKTLASSSPYDIQLSFKDKMLELIKTSDYEIKITEDVLDDKIWQLLKFDNHDAEKIYNHIQLLNRVTTHAFFGDDKEESNRIIVKFQPWQLFLLSGKKLPLMNKEDDDPEVKNRYEQMNHECLNNKDDLNRKGIYYALIGENANTVKHLVAHFTDFMRIPVFISFFLIGIDTTEEILSCNPDNLGNGIAEYALYWRGEGEPANIFGLLSPQLASYLNKRIMRLFHNRQQISSIHHAAISGNLNAVRYVHSIIQNERRSQDDRRSPLHYAAYYGHLDVVKYLLDKMDYRISSQDIYGRNALFYAACAPNSSVWQFLLQKASRSDLKATDKHGNNILMFVILNKRFAIFDELLECKSFNLTDRNKSDQTILNMIAGTDRTNYMQKLLGSGLKIDESTLSSAALQGSSSMVEFLVNEHKAYVNLPNSSSGLRPLDRALERTPVADSENMVNLLLTLGADIKLTKNIHKSESATLKKANTDRLVNDIIATLNYFTDLNKDLGKIVVEYLLGILPLNSSTRPEINTTDWQEIKKDQATLNESQLRASILLPLQQLADAKIKASDENISLARALYITLTTKNIIELGTELSKALEQAQTLQKHAKNSQTLHTTYLEQIKKCLSKFDSAFPKPKKYPTILDISKQSELKFSLTPAVQKEKGLDAPPTVTTRYAGGTRIFPANQQKIRIDQQEIRQLREAPLDIYIYSSKPLFRIRNLRF